MFLCALRLYAVLASTVNGLINRLGFNIDERSPRPFAIVSLSLSVFRKDPTPSSISARIRATPRARSRLILHHAASAPTRLHPLTFRHRRSGMEDSLQRSRTDLPFPPTRSAFIELRVTRPQQPHSPPQPGDCVMYEVN